MFYAVTLIHVDVRLSFYSKKSEVKMLKDLLIESFSISFVRVCLAEMAKIPTEAKRAQAWSPCSKVALITCNCSSRVALHCS